jgi:hypothetical protein
MRKTDLEHILGGVRGFAKPFEAWGEPLRLIQLALYEGKASGDLGPFAGWVSVGAVPAIDSFVPGLAGAVNPCALLCREGLLLLSPQAEWCKPHKDSTKPTFITVSFQDVAWWWPLAAKDSAEAARRDAKAIVVQRSESPPGIDGEFLTSPYVTLSVEGDGLALSLRGPLFKVYGVDNPDEDRWDGDTTDIPPMKWGVPCA